MNKEVAISDLGDVGGCSPMQGHCTNPTGTVIWKKMKIDQMCLYKAVETHKAVVQGRHVVIEKINITFIVDRQIEICNLMDVHMILQGVLLMLNDSSSH